MFKNLNLKHSLKIANFKFQIISTTDFLYLVLVCVLFFILRLPSLFEPYWYGDEGIYEVIGLALSKGRLLYAGIWDNKPPMLYLLYAMFQGDQTSVRLLSLFFGLASIIAMFFLSKKLFATQKAVFFSTGLFACLFGIPFLEGNIANAENFMLFPIILAGLFVYKSLNKLHRANYLLLLASGLLLGFAFLTKVVAVFDLGAFTLFLLFLNVKKITLRHTFNSVIQIIPLFVGFFVPLFLTMLFFFFHGQLHTFIVSAFLSNVGYVNYNNQFIIPQGLLILKLLLLAAVCLGLFILRRKLSPSVLFILLWLSFAIFNAFFAQRPYTHYLLVVVPSIVLFLTLAIEKKKFALPIVLAFLFLCGFFMKNFSLYTKTPQYYANFFKLITNTQTLDQYNEFFDKITTRDATIASYITKHLQSGGQIFVWGNSGQIYKLTNTLPPGRFIVAYHIVWTKENTLETIQALQKTKPQFIIVFPNQEPLPYSLRMYRQKEIIDQATIYEKLF